MSMVMSKFDELFRSQGNISAWTVQVAIVHSFLLLFPLPLPSKYIALFGFL
jgi:hypothetical protein